MERKTIDCRQQTEIDCTLTISGPADDVLRAAKGHAKAVHGFQDSPELESILKGMMQDEQPLGGTPGRKVADCRDMPSERNCSLTISGRPAEVLETAEAHAVADHAHAYSPRLREEIGRLLVDESIKGEPAGASAY